MNSRERLLAVYNGQKPDRTPVTLFVTDTDIEDGPPNCVIGDRSDDVIEDLIRFHEVLGIDIILRISMNVFEPVAFDVDTDDWRNVWEPLDGGKYLVHKIVTPGGQLQEVFNVEGEEFHGDYKQDWMKLRNVRTEAFIKKASDLELMKQYRPALPEYDFSHVKRISEKLGDRGVILPRVVSSVFNYAVGLYKLEDLFVAPMLEPQLYKDLMEFCEADVIAVGEKIVAAGGDIMRIVGNIANAGMVGEAFYMEHIYDYEKRYVDSIVNAGSKVLFHNCGQCSGLLGVYGKMLDGQSLESFSTESTGGDVKSLKDARKALGDNVIMVGNFDQVQLLRTGTVDEVKKRVKAIFDETAGDNKFIFSTSDSIIPGTPRENIVAMCEAAIECAETP